MTSRYRIAVLCLMSTLAVACRAQPADDGGADDEAAAEATAETAAAEQPSTEANADRPAPSGLQGAYTGNLDRAGTPVENHVVEVLTDGEGNPQIGIWEFCNVDLTGSGTTYTSVPGSTCLVDLGEGRKEYSAVVTAEMTAEHIEAQIVFGENVATWKYDGRR